MVIKMWGVKCLTVSRINKLWYGLFEVLLRTVGNALAS